MAKKRGISLYASGNHPDSNSHPNRTAFTGVLTLVDVESDKAPSGARGHRVILTKEAAEEALPSLLGMAVDYKAGWDGHDARQKCGIITCAEIVKQEIRIKGYLFSRDFPELESALTDPDRQYGMSYELADAHVVDQRSLVWTLSRATFTGAAILLKDKAAYRDTSFSVARPATPNRRRFCSWFEESCEVTASPAIDTEAIGA